ncbi:MAG TPA: HAD family hydrolase [Pyrinomonadaceae bacterium]|nr:HAD family hydrolase [Pyrinomonadaceae bacterium]
MPVQSSAPPTQAVIFDGDDTLWLTEQLYDRARLNARNIVVAAGLDGTRWEARERQLDTENVAKMGFGFERFPTSCVEAYEELSRNMGFPVDPLVSQKVAQAAASVFNWNPMIAVGAKEGLFNLRLCGFKLALLTKGNPELQSRRIESSGLKELFDVISIVAEKNPEVIKGLVRSLGVEIGSAWMVGNSARSDILPALSVGMRAIWIETHVWEYERAFDHLLGPETLRAANLSEAVQYIVNEESCLQEI